MLVRRWPLIGIVCLLGAITARAGDPPSASALTVSVVPQSPRLILHGNWKPFVDALQHATGQSLSLQLHETIPDFEAAVLAGTPDLAYMNPYHAVLARRAQNYVPLIRDGSRTLVGILVVRSDSPYRSVKDLNGERLAFPAPNAFGASLYMRALLREREGISFTPYYVKTHANTYRHVILRQAAAGGGVLRTLRAEGPALKAQLRVLYETPGVSPHPLGVHPRVSPELQERIASAILALRDTEAGRALLASVQLTAPVRADYARDYAPLAQLNLERYLAPSTQQRPATP